MADAAGATGLILTSRRAPPLSAAVSRASAGAIEWLPTARVPNLVRALKQLKQQGFWVFGADPEGTEGLFELPRAGDPRAGAWWCWVPRARGLRPGILRASTTGCGSRWRVGSPP